MIKLCAAEEQAVDGEAYLDRKDDEVRHVLRIRVPVRPCTKLSASLLQLLRVMNAQQSERDMGAGGWGQTAVEVAPLGEVPSNRELFPLRVILRNIISPGIQGNHREENGEEQHEAASRSQRLSKRGRR